MRASSLCLCLCLSLCRCLSHCKSQSLTAAAAAAAVKASSNGNNNKKASRTSCRKIRNSAKLVSEIDFFFYIYIYIYIFVLYVHMYVYNMYKYISSMCVRVLSKLRICPCCYFRCGSSNLHKYLIFYAIYPFAHLSACRSLLLSLSLSILHTPSIPHCA